MSGIPKLVFPLIALFAAPLAAALGPPAAEAMPSPTAQRAQAYFHLMRANFAAREGRPPREVLAELRLAIKLQPDSADLRAEGANLLLALGQRDEAEKYARSALRLDPNQPTALRLLAEVATARALGGAGDGKSLGEAIRLYEALIEGPEVDDDALRTLARLKFHAGDVAGAVRVARRLGERRKGDVRVVHMIVQMLRQEGRDPEALEEILNFISRHGEENALIPQVSELARTEDQWRAVEAMAAGMLEADPERTALRKLRGEALLQLEDFAAAAAELETVLREEPDDPLLLFRLTNAYTRVGRLADAVTAARSLAAAMPGNPNVLAVLGDTLARQRDTDAALEALGAALDGFAADDLDPERRDVVRQRMISLLLERGELDRARTLSEGLEQPDEPESLELRIRLAIDGEDLAEAKALTAQLRDGERGGMASLYEGEIHLLEGRGNRARTKFREAAAKLGPSIWASVAEIWARAERVEEGERAMRVWVRQEPDSADAHFSLGAFLERHGDFGAAEVSLRRALELDPNHANALNYLGYSLADRGLRLQEALVLIRRALEIDPWNGAYLDSLGWVFYRLGRFSEAREPLERAAREYPTDPTVLEHLGDLYDRLGEPGRALELWKRALEHGPADPEALKIKLESRSARTAEPGGVPSSGAEAEIEPAGR